MNGMRWNLDVRAYQILIAFTSFLFNKKFFIENSVNSYEIKKHPGGMLRRLRVSCRKGAKRGRGVCFAPLSCLAPASVLADNFFFFVIKK